MCLMHNPYFIRTECWKLVPYSFCITEWNICPSYCCFTEKNSSISSKVKSNINWSRKFSSKHYPMKDNIQLNSSKWMSLEAWQEPLLLTLIWLMLLVLWVNEVWMYKWANHLIRKMKNIQPYYNLKWMWRYLSIWS